MIYTMYIESGLLIILVHDIRLSEIGLRHPILILVGREVDSNLLFNIYVLIGYAMHYELLLNRSTFV